MTLRRKGLDANIIHLVLLQMMSHTLNHISHVFVQTNEQDRLVSRNYLCIPDNTIKTEENLIKQVVKMFCSDPPKCTISDNTLKKQMKDFNAKIECKLVFHFASKKRKGIFYKSQDTFVRLMTSHTTHFAVDQLTTEQRRLHLNWKPTLYSAQLRFNLSINTRMYEHFSCFSCTETFKIQPNCFVRDFGLHTRNLQLS